MTSERLPAMSLFALVLFLGGCMLEALGTEEASPGPGADRVDAGRIDCVPPAGGLIHFAGMTWSVKEIEEQGPGPNAWRRENVCVDRAGRLHLRIVERDGTWTCAEVRTTERLGFGTYEFDVAGRIDRLDPNVVVGLFSYPTLDVGPDGTNEIDIEFARWGVLENAFVSYTVWPQEPGRAYLTNVRDEPLFGTHTTHRYTWEPDQVEFESFHGHRTDEAARFRSGGAVVDDPAYVPQEPMPVHLNLWLHKGRPPSDGEEAELIVSDFRFTAAERPQEAFAVR